MITLLVVAALIMLGFSLTLAIYYIRNKKRREYYCDLYKDSKILDSGLCSAGVECDTCPHKKRLV